MNPNEKPAGFKAFVALLGVMVAIFALAVSAEPAPSGQGAVYRMGENFAYRWDDDATANVIALTATSQQFTITSVGQSAYMICAHGNTAYILCGSNPTATTSIGGHSMFLEDGQCSRLLRFDCVDSSGGCAARKCAFIASSVVTGAEIQFLRFGP